MVPEIPKLEVGKTSTSDLKVLAYDLSVYIEFAKQQIAEVNKEIQRRAEATSHLQKVEEEIKAPETKVNKKK